MAVVVRQIFTYSYDANRKALREGLFNLTLTQGFHDPLFKNCVLTPTGNELNIKTRLVLNVPKKVSYNLYARVNVIYKNISIGIIFFRFSLACCSNKQFLLMIMALLAFCHHHATFIWQFEFSNAFSKRFVYEWFIWKWVDFFRIPKKHHYLGYFLIINSHAEEFSALCCLMLVFPSSISW